jgi:hypothetical protein
MGGTMMKEKTDELEQLFLEDSHCEMKHKDSVCAADVTHVVVDCRRTFLMCVTGYQLVMKMLEHGGICRHCQKMNSSCWKVTKL